MSRPRIPIPKIQFRFSLSAYFSAVAALITLCFNNQAFRLIFLQDRISSLEAMLFHLSTLLLIFALILTTMVPFAILNLPKLGTFFFVLISALSTYFSLKYGIIIDETVTKGFFETTYGEAFQYFNLNFMIWLVAFVVIALSLGHLIRIKVESFRQRIISSLKMLGTSLTIVLFLGLFFYKDYAAFLRNHRQIRHMIFPLSPIYEVGRYWKVRSFPKVSSFTPIGLDAHRSQRSASKRKKLVVIVLGETARADHFSLNGYHNNNTTPLLSRFDLTSFSNVSSCGTATAVSVPCLFSDLGRDAFDSESHDSRENLLDVAHRAGYKVSWLDNNTGCQGVCSRISQLDLTKYQTPEICHHGTCYDEILVSALKESTSTSQDQLIVLHTLGSHGPTYRERYPDRFHVFTPACETSDLSQCSQNEVINTYDNTILYTDFVLTSMIEYLQSLSHNVDTALIYVSDHGESLGENGIYLHSLPYVLAPQEQKKVPMIFWFSDQLKKTSKVSRLIETKQNTCPFSHDHFFSTMIRLLDIQTGEYQQSRDLFAIDMKLCSPRFVKR